MRRFYISLLFKRLPSLLRNLKKRQSVRVNQIYLKSNFSLFYQSFFDTYVWILDPKFTHNQWINEYSNMKRKKKQQLL